MTRTDQSLFQVFRYSIEGNRALIIVAGAFTVASTLLSIVFPYFAQQIIDALIIGTSVSSDVWLFILVAIAASLTQAAGQYGFGRLAEDVQATLRRNSLRSVLLADLRSLRGFEHGSVLSRVATDTTQAKSLPTVAFHQLLVGSVAMSGTTVLMLLIDPILFLLTLALAFLPVVAATKLLPLVRDTAQCHREQESLFIGEIERVIVAFPTVKASVAENAEYDRISQSIERSRALGSRIAGLGVLSSNMSGLVVLIAFVSVISIGGWRVERGLLTVGEMVAFLLYAMQLSQPVMQLTQSANLLQRSRASLERVMQLSALEAETIGLRSIDRSPHVASETGLAIAFRGVSVSYREMLGRPVIEDLSFETQAQGLVVITGPSGVGKSTALRLIVGLEQVTKGAVYLSDLPVDDWPRDELRRRVALVEQDTPVLAGTIRENLIYGLEVNPDDDDLLYALNQVGLSSKFDTAEALDFLVGPRGQDLSGGECQRIAIARALLRDPEVLLLDEATSQLDKPNRQMVMGVLQNLSSRILVILVTHQSEWQAVATQILDLGSTCPRGDARGPAEEDSGSYPAILDRDRSMATKEGSSSSDR